VSQIAAVYRGRTHTFGVKLPTTKLKAAAYALPRIAFRNSRPVLTRFRGTRVALSDIIKLLFEIVFRGTQPDDPQWPRSGLAVLISSARRAFHFRKTSS
jgi:hypothetical protein